jgi:SAM-dependent methyltransferase
MLVKHVDPHTGGDLQMTDDALRSATGRLFSKVNGAYRFVTDDNYTANFGFQWNKFRTVQIDRCIQVQQSHDRFFAETNWNSADLAEKAVLEVGSGAGRFTQVVLDHTRAVLYSVDYSNAVEANYSNNGHHGARLRLYQASIYELPFAPMSFDRVFCFGVLQHTPDVRKSVHCLAKMVKPGGELVVDFYPIRGWWTKIHIKYLLRPLTVGIHRERLLRLIEHNIGWLIRLARITHRCGLYRLFGRFIPIAGYAGHTHGISPATLREQCILDTFDMFSPVYDQPQRISTVARWFREMGLQVTFAGFVRYSADNAAATVRGRRPEVGKPSGAT